jgi:hypothetical protein
MSMSLSDTLHRRLLAAPFDPSLLERSELRGRLAKMLREEAPLLSASAADVVLDEVVDNVGGLGPLEPLLADPTVTEIMVNGPGRVYVERAGCVAAVACDIDAAARRVECVEDGLGLRIERHACSRWIAPTTCQHGVAESTDHVARKKAAVRRRAARNDRR